MRVERHEQCRLCSAVRGKPGEPCTSDTRVAQGMLPCPSLHSPSAPRFSGPPISRAISATGDCTSGKKFGCRQTHGDFLRLPPPPKELNFIVGFLFFLQGGLKEQANNIRELTRPLWLFRQFRPSPTAGVQSQCRKAAGRAGQGAASDAEPEGLDIHALLESWRPSEDR